ncbi:MAG: 5'/3'-nucleotidase SurE [Nitrospirae bacterium]|nr:5'/3'-nucleotidase SurE [Nitrospirota bacterium]
MPTILVTNDDGISSPGIKILSKALKPIGDVYVVAPEAEQSAVAHALTLHRPLKTEKAGRNTFSVNGTPTDCVIISVDKILPRKPDIIVSGINNGANLGDDITYSGTVAAAMEGTLLGVPSIAVSLVRNGDDDSYRKRLSLLKAAAEFTIKLAKKVLEKGLPPDTLLNVNVPNVLRPRGVKFTKQGKPDYYNAVREISDPRGKKYYWICGGAPQWRPDEDYDLEAIQKGYISITPVHLDLTNYEALKRIKKEWKL